MLNVTNNQEDAKSKPQYYITTYTLGWLLQVNQKLASVGRMWRNENLCALLVGMQNGAATIDNSMAVSQKIKNRMTI